MKTMELHHNLISHVAKAKKHAVSLTYSSDYTENARIVDSISQGLKEVEMMKQGLITEISADELLEELEAIVD